MIAQEVLPVFPDLVGGNEEQYYNISYMRLGAVALQGVAEVNYKVDKFKEKVTSEVDKLKERVRGLEEENELLKKKLNLI
jgi:cell division protein FtsB